MGLSGRSRDKKGIQADRDRNSLRMKTVSRYMPDGPDKESILDQLEAKGTKLYKAARMLDGGYDPRDQHSHN